jgi:putative SOS response-associated peptidase YedK
MCGRYTLTSTEGLQLRFELVESSETRLRPRFNVAPSQGVPVVVESGRGRVLRAVRWGFQPVWVRGDARRPPPINARAEGVATNALFRDALARRRCLVVADGFYEFMWTVSVSGFGGAGGRPASRPGSPRRGSCRGRGRRPRAR